MKFRKPPGAQTLRGSMVPVVTARRLTFMLSTAGREYRCAKGKNVPGLIAKALSKLSLCAFVNGKLN
jgi:hypothetical protein